DQPRAGAEGRARLARRSIQKNERGCVMAESFQTIVYETKGPVGILTLNRPDRLNALAPELVEEVGRCLDAVEKDDEVRVLILTGAGRAFSAGFDLKEEAGKPWGTVDVVKPILERCFAFIV